MRASSGAGTARCSPLGSVPASGRAGRSASDSSARSWGFEFEQTWQVTDQFQAFTSVGYLHSEFLTFNHASYGGLAGEPFPEAPEWTVAFGGRYNFNSGFYAGGDAKYTSSYLGLLGIPPQDKVNARFIVNAQAGYRAENFEVIVFAENLFDEYYYTVTDAEAFPAYAQVGLRRSFGVTLKAKF